MMAATQDQSVDAGTKLAQGIGYRTVVVDPRKAFGTRERFPHVDRLITEWPDDALKALGANGAPQASDAVSLTAPDIAENGAVVPLVIASTLPDVKQLVLLVEKNPSALVATFKVTPDVEANFSTRTKMGESSDVYAVAITADGKAHYTKKEVKVTLGGCGG